MKNKLIGIFRKNNNNKIESKNCIDYYIIYDKYKFTSKEKAIFELILQGLFNKEISYELNISLSSVEYNIRNIYKKLNIKNRADLIKLFLKE
jgi:DNA-binding NarL/FixJ family response regulator